MLKYLLCRAADRLNQLLVKIPFLLGVKQKYSQLLLLHQIRFGLIYGVILILIPNDFTPLLLVPFKYLIHCLCKNNLEMHFVLGTLVLKHVDLFQFFHTVDCGQFGLDERKLLRPLNIQSLIHTIHYHFKKALLQSIFDSQLALFEFLNNKNLTMKDLLNSAASPESIISS